MGHNELFDFGLDSRSNDFKEDRSFEIKTTTRMPKALETLTEGGRGRHFSACLVSCL